MVTGKEYDVIRSGKLLKKYLSARYMWLLEKSEEEIMEEYNSRLYKKGEEVRLKKESMVFSTSIVKVTANGELITFDTLDRTFNVGDVDFV
jgi:BirA family biotin operon repressor/biotin-[acetyl-CoA-carboxylase] ligase